MLIYSVKLALNEHFVQYMFLYIRTSKILRLIVFIFSRFSASICPYFAFIYCEILQPVKVKKCSFLLFH